uniref:Galectin n=1 Tax=Esox lucius TaxID=8010 RepID=A0AAY5L2V2_ESOLU
QHHTVSRVPQKTGLTCLIQSHPTPGCNSNKTDSHNMFQIDLGSDTNNLALHFNPRFPNDTGEATLVCNSKDGGCWGAEQREKHLNLQRGSLVKLMGDMFEVELPDGKEFQFPNRHGLDVITYVRVRGDFKCTCFKIC